jgi:hypothetical protein
VVRVSLIFSSLILHHLLFTCFFRVVLVGSFFCGVLSTAPSGAWLGELLVLFEDGGVDLTSEIEEIDDAFDEAEVREIEAVISGDNNEGAGSLGSTNLIVDPSTGVDGTSGVGGVDPVGVGIGVEYGAR